jgi:hypothetical protein
MDEVQEQNQEQGQKSTEATPLSKGGFPDLAEGVDQVVDHAANDKLKGAVDDAKDFAKDTYKGNFSFFQSRCSYNALRSFSSSFSYENLGYFSFCSQLCKDTHLSRTASHQVDCQEEHSERHLKAWAKLASYFSKDMFTYRGQVLFIYWSEQSAS